MPLSPELFISLLCSRGREVAQTTNIMDTGKGWHVRCKREQTKFHDVGSPNWAQRMTVLFRADLLYILQPETKRLGCGMVEKWRKRQGQAASCKTWSVCPCHAVGLGAGRTCALSRSADVRRCRAHSGLTQAM